MRTLYLDCFSGISGDMFIGALIDAGGDSILLEEELQKLNISEEYKLSWRKVVKNGISSTKFDVELTETVEHKYAAEHDHQHEHSDHQHEHEHDHQHEHSDHQHKHEHDHQHEHSDHQHEHEHDHQHEHSDHQHKHEHDHQHEHSDHQHKHEHDHQHEHSDHQHEHEHDHQHEHSDHQHKHEHDHQHEHSDHQHKHEHDHQHEHGDHQHEHSHHHSHRAYQDIVKLIERSQLSQEVKETSLNIFRKIGEAEGLIHGISLEKVHFHEVGAVDSIIDIVGASILINKLEIQKIKSSPVCVGTGKVHIDHGIYPIPAPATLEILKGVPLQQSSIKSELTTPTGAAIVSVLSEEFCTVPSMTVQSVGYGAGTKDFEKHPNVLRVIIGEED